MQYRTRYAAITAAILALALPATAIAKSTSVVYDSFSSNGADYNTKWAAPYGPGEGATSFTGSRFNVTATPFTTGADFSVFDHLKYIRISSAAFAVPSSGSLEFGVDINASTPGTQPGRIIHGCYGLAGSYTSYPSPCTQPYAQ